MTEDKANIEKALDSIDEIDEYLRMINSGAEKKESMMQRVMMISANLEALKSTIEKRFNGISCEIIKKETSDDYNISFSLVKSALSYKFIEITVDMDDDDAIISMGSEKSSFSTIREMSSIIGGELQKPKFWSIVGKMEELK